MYREEVKTGARGGSYRPILSLSKMSVAAVQKMRQIRRARVMSSQVSKRRRSAARKAGRPEADMPRDSKSEAAPPDILLPHLTVWFTETKKGGAARRLFRQVTAVPANAPREHIMLYLASIAFIIFLVSVYLSSSPSEPKTPII